MPHTYEAPDRGAGSAGVDDVTILLVDDHSLIRSAIRTILTEELGSVCVLEAENGTRALQMLDDAVDCIILDISLPDISGLDVLQSVRSRNPTIPILMLSMHAEGPVVSRALQLGATGYVTKGLAAQELITAIQTVMRGDRYLSPTIEGIAS